jgi:outer membrane protein OmpA-like peptidoglycan-associated protein
MTHLRLPGSSILPATLGAALLVAACGPQRIKGPSRLKVELIVLLPDSESGAVGRARVFSSAGTADLNAARDSTQVSHGVYEPPGVVTTLGDPEVDRIFGEALAALPAPPRRFTLHFRFESDELTDESRALVPDILKSVTERSVPDVVIVGHTDTTGAPQANFELGLKRATTVRTLLVGVGLDANAVEVISHGERDLLVQTPDDTLEPRNRRVEIAVR